PCLALSRLPRQVATPGLGGARSVGVMRIAVFGAGGVGGYFGGRLAASGANVSFVARGAHLAAIRAKGLKVTSPQGDVHVPNPKATDRPAEIGPVDVVLFAPKLYDCESAAEAAKP